MKVLKTGLENSEVWRHEYTCTGAGWVQPQGATPCGALLEVSGQDIVYRDHIYMGRDTERYYGFTCPICQCFTELKKFDLPRYVTSNCKRYTRPIAVEQSSATNMEVE